MAWYSLLYELLGKDLVPRLAASEALPRETRFALRRRSEAWKFGSGMDYFDH